MAALWCVKYGLVKESFYKIKYRSSIITSKVSQKINVSRKQ